MKKYGLLVVAALAVCFNIKAAGVDSAYLFAYATKANEGRSGLHFAWSRDKTHWQAIGQDYGFLKSDYGRWGSEKRMINPVLFFDRDKQWHCIWNLNNRDGAVAYTISEDLLHWKPQSYYVNEKDLVYVSASELKTQRSNWQRATIDEKPETGSLVKLPWSLINGLIKQVAFSKYRDQLWAENTKEDPVRFAALKPVSIAIRPDFTKAKKISNMLFGAFFEDINYAADGGLYAELIQNRDFEYDPADKEGKDPGWNSKTAWSISGDDMTFTIDSLAPIHPNNKHYAVLISSKPGAALINEGFDGIALKAGAKYNLSLFARMLSDGKGTMRVQLTDTKGKIYGTAVMNGVTGTWQKLTAVITAGESVSGARLEIVPMINGTIALDMISLFPQQTFKGRTNGMRADLAQTIAALHPRFIRFPGGCVAHGDGIENIYHWKNTIGPLESRKPQRNLWGYHQSMGLGYYEYFRFCEDIGAAPLPVVAAGVPCQNSGQHGHPLGGQQCGIPLSGMNDYIQEILDLVEWANGAPTTKWGKLRAAAGHPKPFNLTYIGIGNEDLISDVFKERFTMIYKAVKKKYPEITVIGTVGPFFEGSDYTEGWKFATQLKVPVVDEHYYVPPGWFIYNQDFYDNYDRTKPKVYVGEYAAHLPGRPSNLETALAEAVHLTALERNGDVVHMSSYAPLLAKEGHTQWRPDLIYFNNTAIKPTVDYYVQQLFGQNAGDEYIPGNIVCSDRDPKVKNRIASSVVRDAATGDVIIKLVSLLPVAVSTSLDIPALKTTPASVIKTVLAGRPDAGELKPEQTTGLSLSDIQTITLSPYSFTVLRISRKR
ncbi:MAG: carbohydrate binding domain-containing protein [Niabella sp.]|nr:carbohydrate binding domain-containing protein [Niabella sp.]